MKRKQSILQWFEIFLVRIYILLTRVVNLFGYDKILSSMSIFSKYGPPKLTPIVSVRRKQLTTIILQTRSLYVHEPLCRYFSSAVRHYSYFFTGFEVKVTCMSVASIHNTWNDNKTMKDIVVIYTSSRLKKRSL